MFHIQTRQTWAIVMLIIHHTQVNNICRCISCSLVHSKMWWDMKTDLSVFYVWKLRQLTVCSPTNSKDTWRHYTPLSKPLEFFNIDRNPWLQKKKKKTQQSTLVCRTKEQSYFTTKTFSGFPSDVLWLLVPSNYPVLRSAGSLHVAFRNLRESQDWVRAVIWKFD